MNDKRTDFLIFCVEAYKNAKGKTGRQALSIFDASGATDFILDCYEALHVEGKDAIVWQIDDFISHRTA
jgi:hypothetical protein